MLELVCHGKNR